MRKVFLLIMLLSLFSCIEVLKTTEYKSYTIKVIREEGLVQFYYFKVYKDTKFIFDGNLNSSNMFFENYYDNLNKVKKAIDILEEKETK